MGQQQVHQPGQSHSQAQQRRRLHWKHIVIVTIIVAFLLAFACLILWNLINEGVLRGASFVYRMVITIIEVGIAIWMISIYRHYGVWAMGKKATKTPLPD
jgi:hypothetical protein